MTLREVLARARTPPKRGDHEIVKGPEGLAHMAVVTYIHHGPDNDKTDVVFMCRCNTLRPGPLDDLEVAPVITCMECMQW